MTIRAWTRAFEKRCLRPLGKLLPRRPRGFGGGRVDHLERRVAELEGLVRELTGLVYLELDHRCDGHGLAATRAAEPREAA
ncbi:MAG: hypothetical protein ACKOCX_13660 [Planctomycetota bacterium]